jgi:hypothetical protein
MPRTNSRTALALRPALTFGRRGDRLDAGDAPGGKGDRTLIAAALTAAGAACLALEGAVHLQQLVEIFHSVSWIGPLFALNAAACAVTIIGILTRRTRTLATIAGVAVSLGALVALALSYTVGLFGWVESGLRMPIALAIASEIGAIVTLTGALAAGRLGHREQPR